MAEQWTDGELHSRHPDHVKEKRSASDDERRFEKHIYPIVGGVSLEDFRLEHAELVMQKMERGLSASSRRHVAQLIGRLLAMAVYPCRLIKASPIPRGWLPSAGTKKGFPILYADEDARLLACAEVPLDFRVIYGVLHREGLRRGEALALTWKDLDLERGAIALDENKTDHPRFWKLSPGVAEGLIAWRKLQDDPPVHHNVFVELDTDGLDVEHLAQRLRDHLWSVGVRRHELHNQGTNRGRLTLHTLRHSFVTRALALGKTEDWVRQRTGHVSNELLRYREGARSLAELELDDVLPLVDAIPELREAMNHAVPPSTKRPPTSLPEVHMGQKVGQAANDPAPSGEGFANDSELVHEEGLEPPHLAVPEPKSGASANSATRAMRRREA